MVALCQNPYSLSKINILCPTFMCLTECTLTIKAHFIMFCVSHKSTWGLLIQGPNRSLGFIFSRSNNTPFHCINPTKSMRVRKIISFSHLKRIGKHVAMFAQILIFISSIGSILDCNFIS